MNFLQMPHIKFCTICRPATPFLYTLDCTKDTKLLVTIVHPSTYLKPYMARFITLESNVGGVQISMDKVKDAELTGIIENRAINQPKIGFQLKNGTSSYSVQQSLPLHDRSSLPKCLLFAPSKAFSDIYSFISGCSRKHL